MIVQCGCDGKFGVYCALSELFGEKMGLEMSFDYGIRIAIDLFGLD